jgi:outer membrane protein, heavy metal efflux system
MKSVKHIIKTNGGSFVPQAGLYTATPAHTQANALRGFRFYPCRIILALLLLFCISFSKAQIITLDSVLLVIDKQNPMLQTYDNKVKAMNAYAEGSTSWMAPMVGAGTFMTPYPGQNVMEDRDKGFVMLSIEQNIPNPAKLHANKSYLQSRAAIENQGRAYAFNSLRAEAKTTYYQCIVLEKKMKVLNENLALIQLMKKLAEIRYTYNQGSLGNIYKAEGRLHELENMIFMTEADIEEKKIRLKSLMNIRKETAIQIDTTTQINFKQAESNYDTASIASRRSDVNQIDKTIQSMRYNLQLQSMQRKPDFKIRYDHMSPLGNSMPNQFTLMGMISIPIAPWSSKMYKAEVKGMQYDIEAMKKERQAVLNEASGMIAEMTAQLTRMEQQLTNYETKIIPALRKNYQTLMLAYEENREQLPVVIDGWEALNMAQMEQLNKLESYYMMIVRYEKEIEK